VLQLTGNASVADYQTALRSIVFANSSDNPSTATRTIEWVVSDGDSSSAPVTRSITVNAVNDAPLVTAPVAALSFNEQGSLAIHGSGFSVADTDDNGGVLTAVFSVGTGRILVDAGDSGVNVLSGSNSTSGNSTDGVTLTGSKVQINALLSGSSSGTITYLNDQTIASNTPAASTLITLTVNDQGNSGSDPGNTADAFSEEHAASQTITFNAANDAPSLLGPELISNGDFASGDLSAWTVSGQTDYEAGALRFGEANVAGSHSASQTISTIVGADYTLSFDYRDGRGDLNQSLQVAIDGASNLLTTSDIVTDVEGTSYVRYSWNFTADSTATTITFTDTSDTAGLSNDTNTTDGFIDNISVRQRSGELTQVTYVENNPPILLNADIEVFDPELSTLDDFGGATVALQRNGGAHGDDTFSAQGNLVFTAGTLELSSSAVGSYTNTAGTLTLSFAAGVSNAEATEVLQSIAYANSSDTPPATVQIDWTFSDGNASAQGTGGPMSVTAGSVVNISAVEDAPVVANLGGDTLAYTEGDGAVVIDQLSDSTVTDVDSTNFATGTLTVAFIAGSDTAEDILAIANQGAGAGQIGVAGNTISYGGTTIGTFAGGSGGSNLVITLNTNSDSAAASALLRAITYENSDTNNPTTGDRTVRFVITDGDGASSAEIDTTVAFSAVNDAPVVNMHSSQTIDEDTTLTFSTANGNAISINDLDSGTGIIQAAIEVTNGVFALAETSVLTLVTGNNSGSVMIEGPVTAIFAAFDGAAFTPDQHFNGTATVTVVADDLGNNGTGGSLTDTKTLTVTVNPVNDDPLNAGSLPLSLPVTEDVISDLDLSLINLVDIDSQLNPLSLTLTTASGGQLSTDISVAAGSGITVSGNNSANLTLTGSLTDLNSFINVAANVGYLHDTVDRFGDNSDSISVAFNDNGNTGSGGAGDVSLGVINIDIEAVNDDPQIDALDGDTLSYAEGDDATVLDQIPLSVVADIDSGNFDGGTLTVSITTGADSTEDVLSLMDQGDGPGQIGITANTVNYEGVQMGTFTGGQNGIALVVTLNTAADAPAVSALMRAVTYENTDSNNPTVTPRVIRFVLTDGDGGTSLPVDTFVNITEINDAPSAANQSIITQEDTDLRIGVNDFGFADPIDGDQLASVVIETLPTNGSLLLGGNVVVEGQEVLTPDIDAGLLIYRPDAEFWGVEDINFRVRDDGGLPGNSLSADSYVLNINVEGVNDAPSGRDNTITVDEDKTYQFAAEDFGFTDSRDQTDQLSAVLIESMPDKGSLSLRGQTAFTTVTVAELVNGDLRYLPDANESGAPYSSFTFRVQDDNTHPGPNSDIAARSMTINVVSVSDAPNGREQIVSGLEDNDYVINVGDFGFIDAGDNDEFVEVFIDELPQFGSLILNGKAVAAGAAIPQTEITAGQLIFRPPADYHGSDTLGFRLRDSGQLPHTDSGLIDNTSPETQYLTFDVAAVNDAPSGTDNTIIINEDTVYTFSRQDFGFTDPADPNDNHQLTAITIASLPEIGSLTLAGIEVFESQVVSVSDIDAGALTYRPPENETGTGYRGFSFQVHDSGGTSDNGVNIDPVANQINFDLPGINDSPALIANGATVAEGDSVVIDSTMLFGTDPDDPNPQDLTLTITSLPAHGELTINGLVAGIGDQFNLQSLLDEVLVYQHDESETSADQFGVSLADGGEDGAQSADGLFQLNITEVIDAALVVAPDELLLPFGQSFSSVDGDLLQSGYSSLNSDAFMATTRFQVSLEQPPVHGVVELNADGTFVYVHDGSRIYEDQFSYRVTNEDGVFTIATVSIVIEPPIESAFGTKVEITVPEVEEEDDEKPEAAATEKLAEKEKNKVVEKPLTDTGEFAPVFARAVDATRDTDVASFFEFREIETIDSTVQTLNRGVAEIAAVKQHNRTELLSGSALQPIGVASLEVWFEVYVPTAREVVENPYFLEGLSSYGEELEETNSNPQIRISEELVLGASLSLSIGLVSWALRGGAVFASLMTAGPLWWGMDITKMAVPVSDKQKKEKNSGRDDNQRLEGMFD
jgi:hypothetical protein